MAWYNKYRPQVFADVVGQSLVKSVLENAILKKRIKHAYLFSGPKGVGKTTLARIFAKELNNTQSKPEAQIDIVEMDAASNTGIDDVRQLIESSKNPPIIGEYKIYIIDEVHMLSKPAMNALLKILEEPPQYLVFLLATTNPEKLLPTVLSRLTKLSLSSHSVYDITTKLKQISSAENVSIDNYSIELIAKRSGGSQRDAINMLETIASYDLDTYTLEETSKLLGLLPVEIMIDLAKSLIQEGSTSLDLRNKIESTGMDGETFLGQFLEFLLDQSLQGEYKFDTLIIPLAQVLDLKLPITSISSSIALLQVKINSLVVGSTKSKNLSSQASEEFSINPPVSEKKMNKPTIESKESNNILIYINSLAIKSDTPPMFKMIAQDIQISNQNDNTVTFSISNGIFLSQLNSPKLKSWIEDKIKLEFPDISKIDVEIRSIHKKEEKNESNKIIKETSKIEYSESKVGIELDTKVELLQNSKAIFYSVYNKLPAEMKESEVKVFPAPVPLPKDEKDWDDHTNELFEFE